MWDLNPLKSIQCNVISNEVSQCVDYNYHFNISKDI